jgi:NADH-quinone oxidoreductase subunit H
MTAADLSVGVLFFLGVSAVQTPVVIAAGLGARSKYSVLGSMRAAAQILSYEIPMVLSVVAVVMAAGTMSTNAIVEAQARDGWYVFTPWGAFGLLVFLLSATAESNRNPFDMAEAESELVAGFHTEYSGFKFGLFQMAEFLSGFASCGLAATLFLGGWSGPGFLPTWGWFMVKTYAMFFVLMWFRATLPRFRIDQLLALAWRFLFPLGLLVILASALWHFLPLAPALAACLILLAGGYWGLSALLWREFESSSRPRLTARVR